MSWLLHMMKNLSVISENLWSKAHTLWCHCLSNSLICKVGICNMCHVYWITEGRIRHAAEFILSFVD